MKKIEKITSYANSSLMILFVLSNVLGLPIWVQVTLGVLFFINMPILIIVSYKNNIVKTKDERKTASEIIAAMEAEDYVSVQSMIKKIRSGSVLGTAFRFYILGILVEKTSQSHAMLINNMDKLMDELFPEKKVSK